jgi:outer membrane protein assembly factor BamB
MKPLRQSLIRIAFAIAAIVISIHPMSSSAQENWPQFRGPGARGVSDATNLPETWSKTENVAWATKIAGRGWSSPIIWGDRIFLTSAVKMGGKDEKIKPGLYFGGERDTPKESHRWNVCCIDFKTGKLLWEKTAHEGVPKEGHHLKNTLASETPVTDGRRVYAYFGNVGVFAYDFDGSLIWKHSLGDYPMALNWGTASSPALYDGRLFIVNDNEKHSFVVSIDAETGKELWRVDRDEKSNWATPFVWQNDVRTELVTCGKKKVRSYSLDGKLLWELGGMSSIVIPTPFTDHGLLYVASGYVLSPFKPLFAIRPGASGDITLKNKATSNKFIAWSQPKAGPYNVSPLAYGDNIYVLYDRGFIGCFDALTGKSLYDSPMVRIPTGDQFTSSPWAYNGKIFCLSEDGDTLVIPAGKKFEILRKNSLDEFCMATPAIARGSLFIRTESQLYRISQK